MPRLQVAANKTIRRGNSRFIARGVTAFDGLLCSFEPRTDYLYRETWVDPTHCAATGISQPTFYPSFAYGPAGATMRETVADIYAANINTIRIALEPAMQKASGPYISPVDGVTYPADIDMLDAILTECAKYDIAVILTLAQPNTTRAQNITFLQFLAGRYASNELVWINPQNEIGCTPQWVGGVQTPQANCLTPSAWMAAQEAYVAAIRATGFLNPVVLNPPGYGYRLDLVAAPILASTILGSDPNLIIGIHQYSVGNPGFLAYDLTDTTAKWGQYLTILNAQGYPSFCIMIEETGITNFGNADPLLNPPAPGQPTLWAKLMAWMGEYLPWRIAQKGLGGVIGTNWSWYIPHGTMDANSMHQMDGSLSRWAIIFSYYYGSPPP